MVDVNGTPPAAMLKAYRERQYAKALLQNGEVLLRTVCSYRKMEEASKEDKSEGESNFLVHGQVPQVAINVKTGERRDLPPVQGHFNYGATFHNPCYAFCCSKITVNQAHIEEKLGPHIVEIFDTKAFIDSLTLACQDLKVNEEGINYIRPVVVKYDKGGIRKVKAAGDLDAIFGCKPPNFSTDQEVRIVLVFGGGASKAPCKLPLHLANPSSFCRWWNPPKR